MGRVEVYLMGEASGKETGDAGASQGHRQKAHFPFLICHFSFSI